MHTTSRRVSALRVAGYLPLIDISPQEDRGHVIARIVGRERRNLDMDAGRLKGCTRGY